MAKCDVVVASGEGLLLGKRGSVPVAGPQGVKELALGVYPGGQSWRKVG